MTAAALGAYIVFEDEAGFSMTPPRARTWGRRGHTPVVRVRGRSWRRWSIAAKCCYKPGETSRLIYRPRRHRKHRGKGRDTFAWSDYRDLVVRAHIQLQAPIVLIWDNLNTHRAAGMREYAAAHDWLTIMQLPSYAPDVNPVEGIWSLLRRGPLANTAFTDDEHLERTLRRGLRHIQLRPDLIDGCLTGTGLTLTPPPTTTRRDQKRSPTSAAPHKSVEDLTAASRGESALRRLLLVFGGFGIGWVTTTIVRYVYPPPKWWTSKEPSAPSDAAVVSGLRRWRSRAVRWTAAPRRRGRGAFASGWSGAAWSARRRGWRRRCCCSRWRGRVRRRRAWRG